jgi:hypothetical protein
MLEKFIYTSSGKFAARMLAEAAMKGECVATGRGRAIARSAAKGQMLFQGQGSGSVDAAAGAC